MLEYITNHMSNGNFIILMQANLLESEGLGSKKRHLRRRDESRMAFRQPSQKWVKTKSIFFLENGITFPIKAIILKCNTHKIKNLILFCLNSTMYGYSNKQQDTML